MKHITITGSLGSGKSCVARLLNEALGFPIVSVGGLLREMATEHHMDATAFNIYMEQHPELDHLLDDRVTALGQDASPKIFDSRLAWHFIPTSFKVCLTVADEIAAVRIYKDDSRVGETYGSSQEAQEQIKKRRESEVHRYHTLYNIDLEAPQQYDVVIDTSHKTPREVADEILHAYRESVCIGSYTKEYIVHPQHLADAVGSGDMPVLATPQLIAFMENCAMETAARTLTGADLTTVGTFVATDHRHPSALGVTVSVQAFLMEQEGKKLRFQIEARDPNGVVAFCSHDRFIVSRSKFMQRVNG